MKIVAFIILIIFIFGCTAELEDEPKNDLWKNDSILLMQNSETKEYDCYGCGLLNGEEICIDPAPVMEQMEETPDLFCGKNFELIQNGVPTDTKENLTNNIDYEKTNNENEQEIVEENNPVEKTVVGESFTIPDTGQTKCYDNTNEITCSEKNFSDQDAQYSINLPSYTDNGDGTITDNITGLMWQKSPGEKVTYSTAANNADSFELASYSDWRLPTIKELYSIIDFSGLDPSGPGSSGTTPFINTDYFDFSYGDESSGERMIDSQWATNNVYESSVMGGEECFFGVNFADGRIKCYPTSGRQQKEYFVIYVRGKNYGINSFTDNKDGTITDVSGLLWQKSDSEKGMDWESALEYCEELSVANLEGWRLPNAKELQSIVDYSKSPDTTNSAAIDPVFDVSEITNEAGEKDYPFYWTSTTHANEVSGSSAAYVSFGRALGYMSQFGGWVDVHGAGAQRSDPKTGSASSYPQGHGPQGDAIRILNYVRCVR